MICDFCYRHCHMEEGERGFCQVRENRKGSIVSLHYGSLVALALDPIEKKPLFHFLPGSFSLSLAEQGCNFRCSFCQNFTISQPGYEAREEKVDAPSVVRLAVKNGARSISFTYSEPLVWQDYMLDTAREAKKEGIRTVMVSNGSFSREARERIIPEIDAFNIDVKGDDSYYRDVCKGSLKPVLDGIEEITREGKHLEVTTLVIEGIHTEEMVGNLGRELARRGVRVWHLSRFFPMYHMKERKPTSEEFLQRMLVAAKASGIPYLYAGNSAQAGLTLCPRCGAVIFRGHTYGYSPSVSLEGGRCSRCGHTIYGVFE